MLSQNIVEVPVHQIDEPGNPVRFNAWEEDIDELARSIEKIGLLQPLTLRKKGERFEVIAGHRRLAAIRKLGLPFALSIIVVADDDKADVMKIHENLKRTDVNPVDEAIFIKAFMDKNELTVSEVAGQVGRSDSWVRSRLELLSYPDFLIGYVRSGDLSMAAANELNQIKSPAIKEDYSRIAALQGLNSNRALYWRQQANLAITAQGRSPSKTPPSEDEYQQHYVVTDKCVLCFVEDDIRNFDSVSLHKECLEEYQRAYRNSLKKIEADK